MNEDGYSFDENTEWSEIALNIGISDPLPFSIELEFQSDLDDATISEGLQRKFENNGILVSQKAIISIEEEGSIWLITDDSREYTVRRAKDKLDVYRSPLGLALIDKDYKVLWANKFHQERFPGLLGKTCYEFANGFDKPCAWCPVKLAREDGLIHLALEASPKTESGRELVYSQVVAMPYQRDESGDVSIVLEMIFDFTKSETERYKRGERLYSFCRELSDRIFRATEDDPFYLILFGAVSEDGLGFDEAEIAKLEQETEASEFIVSQRYLLRNEDLGSQNAYSRQRIEESEIDTFVGMLMSRIQVEEARTRLCDFTLFSEEIMNSVNPVRINNREVAIALHEQRRESWAILFLRSKASNSFLFDEKLVDLNLFLSSIQRVYEIKRKIAGIQIATENLDKFLSQWKEEERQLFSAIPLAIGKIHNLKSICGKINESTSILRDLERQNDDYSTIHGDLITNLSRCVSDLSRIADSMRNVLKMSSPDFQEMLLFETVEKMKWIFEQDLKKGRIAIHNRIPQDLRIECDAELISQVFYNLIENSIRAFGFVQRKDKRIEIGPKNYYDELDARRLGFIQRRYEEVKTKTESNDDKMAIQFRDNGPGIAPYAVPRIFDRFFSTRWKGTGLGLYFVKHVVEVVHKGNMTVRSEWGTETTFTITLPKTQTS